MFGIIFFSFYLAVKWELLMIFISLCTAEHNGMKYIYEYWREYCNGENIGTKLV